MAVKLVKQNVVSSEWDFDERETRRGMRHSEEWSKYNYYWALTEEEALTHSGWLAYKHYLGRTISVYFYISTYTAAIEYILSLENVMRVMLQTVKSLKGEGKSMNEIASMMLQTAKRELKGENKSTRSGYASMIAEALELKGENKSMRSKYASMIAEAHELPLGYVHKVLDGMSAPSASKEFLENALLLQQEKPFLLGYKAKTRDPLTFPSSEFDKRYQFYIYRDSIFRIDNYQSYTEEEKKLLILECYHKHTSKFQKLRKEIELFQKLESKEVEPSRESIPEEVRFFVWRRDEGKCIKCGANKNLEFDHIIPVSKGGSNTERNIQLLCSKCNKEKSDKI